MDAVKTTLDTASWLVENWQLLAGVLALIIRGEIFIHRTKTTLEELESDVHSIKVALVGNLTTGSPGLTDRVRALERDREGR